MDRFAERYGLVDTGLVFTVAHSGRTVWRSDTMTAMLRAAQAGEFDVLLTGYFDRWQRNLRRTLEIVEDVLHPSGVSWVMCDRKLISTDPSDWDQMVARGARRGEVQPQPEREDHRRLRRQVQEAGDQGGHAGLGFRRAGDPPVLEIDPTTIHIAVALFERYATGAVSMEELAEEFSMTEGAVTMILRNPIYNGWVHRFRGSDIAERRPAAWRANPPVSDALWQRVEEVRERRRSLHGGPWTPDPTDMLRGILYCVCGTRIKSDGTMGTPPRRRKAHPRHQHCPEWGPQKGYSSPIYERLIGRQLSGVKFDAATKAKLTRALLARQTPVVDVTDRRIERMKRDLALEHAAGRIGDDRYLEQMARLRAESSTTASVAAGLGRPGGSRRLHRGNRRDLGARHARGTGSTRAGDLRAHHGQGAKRGPGEAHADGGAHGSARAVARERSITTAIFARTDVLGFERMEYELTSDAIALGLDAALPAVFELRGPDP